MDIFLWLFSTKYFLLFLLRMAGNNSSNINISSQYFALSQTLQETAARSKKAETYIDLLCREEDPLAVG